MPKVFSPTKRINEEIRWSRTGTPAAVFRRSRTNTRTSSRERFPQAGTPAAVFAGAEQTHERHRVKRFPKGIPLGRKLLSDSEARTKTTPGTPTPPRRPPRSGCRFASDDGIQPAHRRVVPRPRLPSHLRFLPIVTSLRDADCRNFPANLFFGLIQIKLPPPRLRNAVSPKIFGAPFLKGAIPRSSANKRINPAICGIYS